MTQKEVIGRYLLGELSPEEQQSLEQRLMTDDQYFEQLVMAENELVDDYVRDEIDPHDRERFEQHFLSTPDRAHGLRFARALKRYVERAAPGAPGRRASRRFGSSRTLWVAVSLAACVAVAIGGISLVRHLAALEQQIAELRADRSAAAIKLQQLEHGLAIERARAEQLTARLEQPRSRPTPAEESSSQRGLRPAGVLVAMLTRPERSAGASPPLLVGPEVRTVELRVPLLAPGYASYQAVLERLDGGQVWSRDGVAASKGGPRELLILHVPARRLERGDYMLSIFGLTAASEHEPIGNYPFRVTVRR